MQTGYLSLGRVRGALVRIHWSAFALAFFIGFRSAAPLWASLFGSVLIVALVFAHEFGHAWMVWRYRHRVVAIEVFAIHGWCRWDGHPSPYERAMIAWGGVFAQLAVLAAVLPIALLFPQRGYLLHMVVQIFVWTNLMFIAINLIPIAPLDGAEAWKLLPMLRAGPRPARRADRLQMDDGPRRPAPRKGRKNRPDLRLVPPPQDDEDPIPESSRRIADDAIRDAMERSRRKFDEPNGNDD